MKEIDITFLISKEELQIQLFDCLLLFTHK